MSSRNRQRPGHSSYHNQDADEERRLWKGIRSKSNEVDAMVAKSNDIGSQILEAEQAQAALIDASKPTDPALDEKLEKLYRENLKLCEEVMNLVSGNSDGMNLLDSINILAGLREASEASAAQAMEVGLEGRRAAAGGGSGKLKKAARGASATASVKGGSAAASVAGDEATSNGGGGLAGGSAGAGGGLGEDSAAPSPKVRLGVPKEGRGERSASASGKGGSGGGSSTNGGDGTGEKNSRSASVTTTATTRETSVKIEDGVESVASSTDTSSLPIKQESNGNGNTSQPQQSSLSSKTSNRIQFKTGEIVFYRHNTKNTNSHSSSSQPLEGEGILCHVTSVIGEGKQRRYEVQDIDQSDEKSQPMRASVSNLISIPIVNKGLQDLGKGRHVLAQYPDTTTFYKAIVSTTWRSSDVGKGERGEMVRLRFDGEENENIESEVERRLVLLEKER
ncbi:hypothetical protein K431DRAFT_284430 [Polychaeton citri CBS 116435]|uniref:SGF29 C-terminal domain-containing protein n=1 Tax=Polychaeton citri CBS 116435 TaxID=1314669 RepID=A0A9P4Q8Y6_9PEZI|nr:hypothetical protein K431DRAFT_284430 [Polychaeton citri CBS 116435]